MRIPVPSCCNSFPLRRSHCFRPPFVLLSSLLRMLRMINLLLYCFAQLLLILFRATVADTVPRNSRRRLKERDVSSFFSFLVLSRFSAASPRNSLVFTCIPWACDSLARGAAQPLYLCLAIYLRLGCGPDLRLVGAAVAAGRFVFRLPSVSIKVAKECSGIRSSIARLSWHFWWFTSP